MWDGVAHGSQLGSVWTDGREIQYPDVDTCIDTQPTFADEKHQTLAHRPELAY
jgi:hypothetical protein